MQLKTDLVEAELEAKEWLREVDRCRGYCLVEVESSALAMVNGLGHLQYAMSLADENALDQDAASRTPR